MTGPATGATIGLNYDGYGRVRTRTNESGYALTHDYDALDRPTKVTYPDGTYEQTVCNRLDAEQERDRQGQWTHIFHDAHGDPSRRAILSDRRSRSSGVDVAAVPEYGGETVLASLNYLPSKGCEREP